MFGKLDLSILAAAALSAAPALAQSAPPPPPPAAKAQVTPYLMASGMSDVFEITTSQIALMKSQNPQIREYATKMIDHHTMTTNATLKAAKAGGVATPPAPVLDAAHRALISELLAAGPADFDRVYIGQQVPSHQGALDVQTGYSTGGDVATLRTTAKVAVPIVQQHLDQATRMRASMTGM